MGILEDLATAVGELKDYKEVRALTKKALKAGIPGYEIVSEALAKGLDLVGDRYGRREYFIADLVYAASLMREAMDLLEPMLRARGIKGSGVIVMGTVRGDLHDIGKNIVIALLRSAGFMVEDLGVDVPAERFVDKVKGVNADIVGLSSLLTSTMPAVSDVLEALKASGIRDRVKVIVGGRPVTEEFVRGVGADAYASDAMDAVRKAKELMRMRASNPS